MPAVSQLFRDILFDDGDFDLKSLVESALPTLLKQHASSLPIHKYVSRYREQWKKEPPLAVVQCCKTTYDEFLSPTILKIRKRADKDRSGSIDAILDSIPDDRHRIEAMKLLLETEIEPAKLKQFLIDVLARNPDVLTTPGLATDYKRLVRILDWLTYNNKEGPSFDGPSKAVDAPTT